MMKDKKVLFISSTGGHLVEMMQLKDMFNDCDYHVITEKTKSNLKMKETYKDKIDFLVYGTKDHMLTYPFKLLYNCFKSLFLYIKIHQELILLDQCVVLESYLEVELFILKHLLI